MVAAAVIGAGVASAAGSAISSSQQADAIGDAQARADDTQLRMYEQTRQDQMPWLQTGTNALARLSDLAGLAGPDQARAAMGGFAESPGYQYQVAQGLRALDAGAAARGMLRSGATLRAEQALGSNLAGQEYGGYLNRLAALAGIGQQGAQALGQQGTLVGSGIAQTAAGAGSARASIYGNQATGLTNALGGTLGNLAYLDRRNALFSSDPGGNGSGGVDWGGAGTYRAGMAGGF